MTEFPDYAVCVWPVDWACWDGWADLSAEVTERAVALASGTLNQLTMGRISNCPIYVRPCKSNKCGCVNPDDPSTWYWYRTIPYTWGGWVPSCGCISDCSCTQLCEVPLPGPVGRVDEVKVDGDIVDPDDYSVRHNKLLWVGTGECPWPACQDMTLPDTEAGTFSVTYIKGTPPDRLAAYAVGLLAAEFAKACSGGDCALPKGVTQVVRQGVSLTIESGLFPNGFTGIREVDAFIGLWNPFTLKVAPQVYSPDTAGKRLRVL